MTSTSHEATVAADTSAPHGDAVRQWIVAISLVLALAGDAVGSGALGGIPIQNAAGGALSSTATVVAPAVPAFSIWAVIYLSLIGYTAVQFLPSRKADPKQRAIGYPMALSLLLNAAWILTVQADLLGVSVVVIVALLVSLIWAFVIVARSPATRILDAVFVDGATGLYLGWVCVATVANITAGLTAAGFTGWRLGADVWGCLILVLAGVVGIVLAVFGRGRFAPAASLVWGICWIAVARISGDPRSSSVAITALVCAVGILIATGAARITAVLRAPRL